VCLHYYSAHVYLFILCQQGQGIWLIIMHDSSHIYCKQIEKQISAK
jgi:hypothetical protein